MKKFIPLLILLVLIVPVFVHADPIIPCTDNCGFNDLLKLVDNIINWIIMISVPVAAGVFAWAGILYMTTGVSDKKAAAKAMLWKVFWGFVFVLAAWIIVTTIVNALLNEDFRKVININ